MNIKMISKSYVVAIISIIVAIARGQADDDDLGNALGTSYPFQPPTAETCDSKTQLGSDIYISLFAPCSFTFYTPTVANITAASSIDSFSCAAFADIPNETKYQLATARVFGWPDSCVAVGPRCYDLRKYPDLANYTRIDFDSKFNYSLNFPEVANFVSVDCSQDYTLAQEAMKNLPHTLEPVAGAIAFSGFLVFAAVLLLIIACCVAICCCGRRRRGYTAVRGVYTGAPVEATKMVV